MNNNNINFFDTLNIHQLKMLSDIVYEGNKNDDLLLRLTVGILNRIDYLCKEDNDI